MTDIYSMTAAKKIGPTSRPDVFSYHDYREFLRDWFDYLKSEPHKLSLRAIAMKSGYSVSNLSMILSGQRSLTEKALISLSPHLQLESKELRVLTYLRDLSEEPTQKGRQQAFENLKKFANFKSNNQKDWEAHKLLSHWYYAAIREMAQLPEFKPDPVWIQKRLKYKVPKREVEQAVKFLYEHGYLKEENGNTFIPEKLIECTKGIYKLSMAGFHKEMMEKAIDSIEATPSDERNLLTHTLSVKKDKIDELRSILDEALEKVQQLGVEDQSADEVYQVSLLTFPLTQKNLEDKE